MSVKKSESQVIIDAVTSIIIAMLENNSTEIVIENSVIGLSPAVLFKNESKERLAWISIHQGMLCPQVFLAQTDECEYINAPSDGFNEDDGPQIYSPRFQRENKEHGVCGFNISHTRFSEAVMETAKITIRWLIEGCR